MAGGGAMLGLSMGGEGGPATPGLGQRVGDLVNAGGAGRGHGVNGR
jgi:hypothetical protein